MRTTEGGSCGYATDFSRLGCSANRFGVGVIVRKIVTSGYPARLCICSTKCDMVIVW
jgi:hypothetical protein